MGYASYQEDIEDRRNDDLLLMRVATRRTDPQTDEPEPVEDLSKKTEHLDRPSNGTEIELADRLWSMFSSVPIGEQLTGMPVVLFGIRYAAELDASHVSITRVAEISGLESYRKEIRIGMQLAKYVERK